MGLLDWLRGTPTTTPEPPRDDPLADVIRRLENVERKAEEALAEHEWRKCHMPNGTSWETLYGVSRHGTNERRR